MYGMLLLAFLFPVLLLWCVSMANISFWMTLWAGFGLKISEMLPEGSPAFIKILLESAPFKESGVYFLYPLLINCVITTITFVSYNLGGVLYQKRGWKFAQAGKGGLRFVILQSVQWTYYTLALLVPWILPIMHYFQIGKPHTIESYGAMLVCSNVLGVLSVVTVSVALMAFDSENSGIDLRSLESGSWNWKKMFGSSSGNFWWAFITMQYALSIYTLVLLWIDDIVRYDGIVRLVITMTLCCVTAVPVSLTHAVGGKWRHGVGRYHMIMPWRGGMRFMIFQAFGWLLFAFEMTFMIMKVVHVLKISDWLGIHWFLKMTLYRYDNSGFWTIGVVGFFSQIFIAISVLLFDPKLAGESVFLDRLKRSKFSSSESEQKPTTRQRRSTRESMQETRRRTRSKSGTRKSTHEPETQPDWKIDVVLGTKKNAAGSAEFLVQWLRPKGSVEWLVLSAIVDRVGSAVANTVIDDFQKRSVIEQRSMMHQSPKRSVHNSRVVGKAKKKASMKREEEWEECEDENGNIFYYCVTSGKVSGTLGIKSM